MSDWIAAALMVAGGFFCLVAGIGVIRLNDVFARMHAATKAGTLGLALICLAVMVQADTWLQVLEALFVFLFMILTAPVGAHLIGRAAFRTAGAGRPEDAGGPGRRAVPPLPAALTGARAPMDWDDLKLFVLVARLGGLSAAARAAGLSPPTLGRRLQALEASLGRHLFERRASGYVLTADGRELLAHAEPVEAAMLGVERWRDQGAAGRTVRVSAGTWTSRFLAQHIGEIVEPGDAFRLQLLSAEARLDIGRRAADIGLRNRRPEEAWLAGQRVGQVAYAVYRPAADPAPARFVAATDLITPTSQWLRAHHGDAIAVEVSSPRLVLDLRAGRRRPRGAALLRRGCRAGAGAARDDPRDHQRVVARHAPRGAARPGGAHGGPPDRPAAQGASRGIPRPLRAGRRGRARSVRSGRSRASGSRGFGLRSTSSSGSRRRAERRCELKKTIERNCSMASSVFGMPRR